MLHLRNFEGLLVRKVAQWASCNHRNQLEGGRSIWPPSSFFRRQRKLQREECSETVATLLGRFSLTPRCIVHLHLESTMWGPIAGAITGGLASLLINLIFSIAMPRIRRWNLTRSIGIYPEKTHGFHTRLRVFNGGYWTLGNAVCYISIDATEEDVIPPPPNEKAFVTPDHFVPLEEMQVCWSVWYPTINPMKVDIYAKERQPLSPCGFNDEFIMIPSEHGGVIQENHSRIARVFLRRKRYSAVLKIVTADTDARYFQLIIDPENKAMPLTITGINCTST